MDELFDFCKQTFSVGLGVFLGLTAWAWLTERERRQQYRAGLERAMQRAGERMDSGGGVEFIPVEDWPDSLEVKDK